LPRARSADAATLALVEAEFEESLISLEVGDVDWSLELDQVVVADLELDENEF